MAVTTCRQIIHDSLEIIGAKAMNRNPTATQAEQALGRLQNLVLNAPGMDWWHEVEADADYTAGENERVRVTTDSAVTITVPAAVSSARTVLQCCNQITLVCTGYDDRAPKDGARVHVADQYSDAMSTFYYRGDNAQWTAARDLTLDSEVPFSAEFDEGLSAMLAIRMASRYGAEIDGVTAALATATISKMRARFGKRQDVRGGRFPTLSASRYR